eukprot:7100553-Pyramimonas_sp.AAC.1
MIGGSRPNKASQGEQPPMLARRSLATQRCTMMNSSGMPMTPSTFSTATPLDEGVGARCHGEAQPSGREPQVP